MSAMCRVGALFVGLILAQPALSAGLPICESTIEVTNAPVMRVEKNGVLVLEDGRAVHLEGILLPQGAKDHAPEALAQQAIAELSDFSRGRGVTLAVDVPKEDRYGRLRAQAEFPDDNDEPWLQVAMLRRGLARVSISPDRRECASELYAAEAEARAKKRGIWALPFYQVRTPDQLAGLTGTFQIVEGRVVNAEVRGGRAYLDFGPSGFTVMISPDDMENFRTEGVDPRNYAGKMVRVRGFLDRMNGPEIELSCPENAEVIVPP